jgi:hypothetical protein
MLRYKGGTSVANILVLGARNTLMLRERGHMQKGTLGKNLHGPKVSSQRGKVLQGLHIRHASDGSVERNMEPVLGQRRRYANTINKTHNGNILRCKFNKPREGKIGCFFIFRESEKAQKKTPVGYLFRR